ncbi:monovalent cation:proton antiporter-2 (CPA2) family protein [Methylorubrum rhodesianum]|jgi:CPA2 family monovalent cation:H+ antiporter-2/glutathione-regulated potassium-efflux system protein KefB|uniref:monovalent cation:proton antiporter-2 (CPA2) family protein n=1 Tax=Methylorubrum TaxID=2282523 RepID=UPI00160C9779|nr:MULTISPECIES: monovalent cation:proton antiporter-2 (CPA2) family protein [Methylorubrum]MBB5760706.1 CPA2 family monovalent cation:H+ antiporter-2/glutathione-regulated potassium-efflux system protein KefB [Methylorubrum rhodesianum]MBI1689441.1 potassium transporter [Methylorubrum sp. DB1722]
MAVEASGAASELVQVVALLAAGVVAVPLFKRLGLGSVLGYLVAGLAIGPFGLGLFTDAHAILHVAELGVVMFLFIIGLEMEPSRLWGMRREIFGLGLAQVGACIGALTLVGVAMGFPVVVSFVAGTGFVLTSTAIVMQLLEERGALSTPKGQRIVAILLLEDLAIVPLLAAVALLAPGGAETSGTDRAVAILIALLSVAALVAAGRWLLNPLFRLLAAAKAREVMTAAALLVVLGSALAMQLGGLSMAMGAFLAGVLLSESSFRHQLEADVEPFRGILLGLFFLGVGMSLDLAVIAANWGLILLSVAAYMAVKSLVIYAIARLLRAAHAEALERTALMAQGGEFAFVLYAAAAGAGIIDGTTNAVLTATIILSMAITPLTVIAFDRFGPKASASTDGVEAPEDLVGSALIIGFGRFGQIVSQPLISRGCSVSIIDTNADNIRLAEGFGFKVYYGDGARLDILRAAGAATARAILICVDDRTMANRIAELAKAEFPLVPVLARARDREHAVELIEAGVAYQLRETLESAFAFGEQALVTIGAEPEAAMDIMAEVRRRDAERLDLQVVGGIYAGRELIRGNAGQPAHGHG